jgi:hypothetical protein
MAVAVARYCWYKLPADHPTPLPPLPSEAAKLLAWTMAAGLYAPGNTVEPPAAALVALAALGVLLAKCCDLPPLPSLLPLLLTSLLMLLVAASAVLYWSSSPIAWPAGCSSSPLGWGPLPSPTAGLAACCTSKAPVLAVWYRVLLLRPLLTCSNCSNGSGCWTSGPDVVNPPAAPRTEAANRAAAAAMGFPACGNPCPCAPDAPSCCCSSLLLLPLLLPHILPPAQHAACIAAAAAVACSTSSQLKGSSGKLRLVWSRSAATPAAALEAEWSGQLRTRLLLLLLVVVAALCVTAKLAHWSVTVQVSPGVPWSDTMSLQAGTPTTTSGESSGVEVRYTVLPPSLLPPVQLTSATSEDVLPARMPAPTAAARGLLLLLAPAGWGAGPTSTLAPEVSCNAAAAAAAAALGEAARSPQLTWR